VENAVFRLFLAVGRQFHADFRYSRPEKVSGTDLEGVGQSRNSVQPGIVYPALYLGNARGVAAGYCGKLLLGKIPVAAQTPYIGAERSAEPNVRGV
jgi:hypothetical protein